MLVWNPGNTQKVYFAGIKGLEGAKREQWGDREEVKSEGPAAAELRRASTGCQAGYGRRLDNTPQPGMREQSLLVTCPRSHEPEVQSLI